MAGNQVQLNVTADATSAVAEFDRTIRAADKITRALSLVGKEGADDAAILEQVGKQGGDAFAAVIERGEAAGKTAKQIAAELKTLAQTKKNAALDSKADTRAAIEAAHERAAADREVNAESEKGAANIKAQSDALAGLSHQAMSLAASLVQASSAFEQQRAKLTGLYHDTDTARAKFGEFVEFASKTPFEVKSVVDAAIQIQALGQNASEILPIAGDLAARFGRDIPDAAQALGKAMSGSQDGVQVLIDSFGVSRAQLKQYGATVDETGGVVLRGEANLAKFRSAIMGIAKTEWAGSMSLQADTLQGKLSNLSDATEQLKAHMGDGLAPAIRDGAGALTGLIDGLQKSYPQTLEFAGRLVGVAAGVTALTTGIAAATVAIPLLAAAFGPFVLTAMGTVAVLAEVNQGLHEIIDSGKEMDRANKASSDRLQLLAKAHREWAGEGAKGLHAMGVTTRETATIVTALEERLQQMRDGSIAGSAKQQAQVQIEIAQWRALGQQLGVIQQQEAAAAETAKRLREERVQGIKVAQDIAKSEESVLQTTVEARQRELSEAQRTGTATLEHRTAVINAQMALEAKRHADAVQKVRDEQDVAESEGKATAATRGAALREIDALEQAHVEAIKKYESDKAEAAAESERRRMQYAAERITAAQQATADEIALLDARLKAGERVEADLTSAHQRAQDLMLQAEQARHAQALADLKKLGGDQMGVQAEVAKHAETMAHLAAQARLRELQAAQQVHDAIMALSTDETVKREEELRKQVEAFRAAGAAETQIAQYVAAKKKAYSDEDRRRAQDLQKAKDDLAKQGFADDEERLKERAANGENVTAEEIALVQKRHAIERQEIAANLEEDTKRFQSRTAAEELMKARLEENQRKEATEIRNIGKARVDWVDAYIKKLEELQAKEQPGLASGPYSMEEFFKRQKLGNLGPSDEQRKALTDMGLSPDTDISALIRSLRAGSGLPTAPGLAERERSIQAATSSATPPVTPTSGTTINVYLGQSRQTGLTSTTENSLQQAGDSILRDLRFGR